MSNVYVVVMAGGSGTRFWPKSTSRRPKQLLSFSGSGAQGSGSDLTLLGQTLQRFDSWVPPENRMIVTTQSLQGAVQDACPAVKVLAEPQGRNTAPCVYWAAREVAAKDPDAIMLVMPADHYIARPDRFLATVKQAAAWATEHSDLVTLGIKPTRPETGYGYLRTGTAIGSTGCLKVDAFVEKPNLENAERFVQAGNYLWNGGMFVWRAKVVLAAFDRSMPEMKKIWDEAGGRVAEAYPKLTATSVDYGVMEKADNVVTFPLDCGWDDLGSWTSLESLADALHARAGGNVATGGDVIAVESQGNIIDASGRLVALLGVNDLIVVEHQGALLVARKDRAQDIRLIVDQVKKRRPELS